MKFINLFPLLIVTLLFSCVVEQDVSDTIDATDTYSPTTFNQTQSRADFTGRIKRIKIKKKRVGSNFKVVGLIKASTTQFTSFAILLEGNSLPEGCSDDEEWLITPNGPANQNGIIAYTNNVSLPNCIENKPVKLTATPINENGEQVDEAEVVWVTPQDNDGINLVNASSKIKADGESRRFIFRIDGEFVYRMTNVEITSQSFENGIATSAPSAPKKIKRGEVNTGDPVDIIGLQSKDEWAHSSTSLFTLKILDAEDVELETMQIVVDNQPHEEAEGIILKQPVIKALNNGNFKVKVPLAGQNRADVASVDIIFNDYSGPEPNTTEMTLLKTGENNVTDLYVDKTLTFDDPTSVVGETYTVIIELKNNEGNTIESFEKMIIVQ